MNLRRKTVLTMTVTPIIMILIMYVGAQFILMDNYAALEKQRAEVNVKRGLSALSKCCLHWTAPPAIGQDGTTLTCSSKTQTKIM